MSFTIKLRGSPTPTTIADYFCEEHGRFEAQVERTPEGDAPDEIPCVECSAPATWCISAPLARVNPIEAVKGKWQKPERPTWTDTRNLGEGQPLYEWREDRAKVWEEKRKADVMEFARSVNERPIGGD
jgi:hypothetical protein